MLSCVGPSVIARHRDGRAQPKSAIVQIDFHFELGTLLEMQRLPHPGRKSDPPLLAYRDTSRSRICRRAHLTTPMARGLLGLYTTRFLSIRQPVGSTDTPSAVMIV